MNTKQIKITGITLVIASIVILAGIIAFNGIEADEGNIPPGVENVTRMPIKGIYERTSQPAEVASSIAFPMVPEKMVVYKVNRNISENELIQIANNLGISDALSKSSNGFIFIGQGTDQISSYKGTVVYSDKTTLPGYSPDYIDTHLPSDVEARKIADEFLDQHDLRPEGAVFSSTNHDIGHFVSGDNQVEVKNSESINVWYKHWVGDYMIVTDKLHVVVDVNGEVRTMFREWPAYEPYKEFSIIGPEEAFGYLKEAGVFIPSGMKTLEKATVTNISLVYIDQTMTDDLDYLIPVYYFQGEVQGDGTSATFYQCIPATPEFAAEIT